jgi:hypothetical protein
MAKKSKNDEDMYRQILGDALGELEYWEKKYQQIQELKEVINEDKLKELKEKL